MEELKNSFDAPVDCTQLERIRLKVDGEKLPKQNCKEKCAKENNIHCKKSWGIILKVCHIHNLNIIRKKKKAKQENCFK